MYTFIESPLFSKLVYKYLSDEEYTEFQGYLARYPDAGDVVPGSGGVRKLRWISSGKGKRGGVRVVYFNRLAGGEIWLLTIYAKARRRNVPAHILKAMREELEHDQ